jgi:hypothetical protein
MEGDFDPYYIDTVRHPEYTHNAKKHIFPKFDDGVLVQEL